MLRASGFSLASLAENLGAFVLFDLLFTHLCVISYSSTILAVSIFIVGK